eukprot:CAMPEP_0113683344 /NCGR_PEP_ID=MMETSP0038_2-20120614/13242_1 /TAXON_ID=2898 /ORGANISM="Cryptomonas paramecium" /LENGTH=148 /DNA_ID=CAMNT_0000602665 /DNA_START=93 /DNA_END=536 /DNA_ORIENTATION=+ /assembly_acc=CAM_ASM_000170
MAQVGHTVLYNKWGTSDTSDHWGGVGSENYEEGKPATKWDNTGWNENYHPRDSSSGDGESMEPAWWRQGPGANSEYTGHAMDGELYNPPDEKVFKPFFMREVAGSSSAARTPQLAQLPSFPPQQAFRRAFLAPVPAQRFPPLAALAGA